MRKLWLFFQNEEAELNLDECGIQPYSINEKYDYNVYQNFVIHYVDYGVGYLEIDGKKYRLEKGDGYVIKASQHVKYYADPDEPWTTYWVGLSGNNLHQMLHGTILQNGSFFSFIKGGHAQLIIKEICDTTLQLNESIPSSYWYKAKIYMLIDTIRKELSYQFTQELPSAKNLAEIAYDYINNNYMKQISIESISRYLGVSRSYFYKIFKQKYQVSPHQYLHDRRQTIAASLLLSTTLTIAEIAERCGYQDPLYFSKSFSTYYNESPTQFRKNQDYDSYKESWEKFN